MVDSARDMRDEGKEERMQRMCSKMMWLRLQLKERRMNGRRH